jgi:rhamnogalacturonyl hydrolase YesR
LLAEAEDFSYVKNQGLLLGYYLFGDYRLLELAIKVANRLCLVDGLNADRPRSYGLGIIGALTGYEATGEERYLLRAREIADALIEMVKRNKGNIPSDFIYQVGIALEGLLQLYNWDNDPELLNTVRTVTDRVIYDFWDEESGFLQDSGGLTFTSILCKLYEQTGNETYRRICQAQFSRFLNSTEVLKVRDVVLSYRNLYTVLSMQAKQKDLY